MAKNRVFSCFKAKTKHLLPSPSKIPYLFFSLTSAYSVPLWFVNYALRFQKIIYFFLIPSRPLRLIRDRESLR